MLKAPMVPSAVLFTSHEATRTGAPMQLLHFLRWYKKNGNRPFSILLGHDGELTPDFEDLADTWALNRGHWFRHSLRARFLFAAGLGGWARRVESRNIQRFAARCSPALVYANSIVSARIVEALAPRVPILTHVHELEFMFRITQSPALTHLLAHTNQFIACSNAVRENLIREHGVVETQVETVHEFIPVEHVRSGRSREQIFKELSIPDGAHLIVGSGTLTWTKGPDLFVQLARAVCRERPEVYFAWIGGADSLDVARFEHDVRLLGLDGQVHLTGIVPKPADYFAAADMLVLTSRQDSYPLVCLEAAALAKPILCFAESGGMPEFVEKGCGFVVPYLDIMAMAQRVTYLLDSPDCRATMGEAARRKVTQLHDISVAAPRVLEIIERTIAGG